GAGDPAGSVSGDPLAVGPQNPDNFPTPQTRRIRVSLTRRRSAMRRIATLGLLLGVSLTAVGAGGGAKPPPASFTPLFTNKDLTGWKVDEAQAKSWKVEDGTIHYTGKGGRNLATAKDYKNFELWVDWKITPKGDSGIYLRGQPQVQIWDNPEGSGTLWNN